MTNQSFLGHAIDLVANASPDVHAALIGNVGLFLGGVLTFFTAAYFAGRQFRHERIEKAKDRALELKKELLVDGIRGAQEIIDSLNLAADIDRPHTDATTTFQSGSRKLVAAAAVAHIDSVSAGRDFLEIAGPAMLGMLSRRSPASLMSDEINWWQEEINRQSAVIQTMLDELRAATIAGNDQRAQALNAILEASRQIYATMAEENQTRRESLMPLRLELSAAMLDEVTKLSGALDLLLAAVRKDIGVDTNVSDRLKFLAAARIDVPRLRSQYDAFVAELTSSANESARQDS